MIDELFKLGMKRELPKFKDWSDKFKAINIGSGNHKIEHAENFDLPEYNADVDLIPCLASTVGVIHCYHVLEHLKNPMHFLQDCQRVLEKGGLLNICVPHYKSEIAYHDLTHERAIALDTFETLLKTEYYKNHKWEFELVGAVAIGIADRNLSIIAQLEKK